MGTLPEKGTKGRIGILTGGGDVPGLNPAIKAVTIRALNEGYDVVGIRRGWDGLLSVNQCQDYDEQNDYLVLDSTTVAKVGRTGGTFLHSSRINPVSVRQEDVPDMHKDKYTEDRNDMTDVILSNLEFLGIDILIPIGGDDTLSYGAHLHTVGFKVVAIPKTMDNDVPGTDYCIGFSTCITLTVEFANRLRTCAGSHERFLVIEVFGRYAGFTALLPAIAGAADRCVIPEHEFDIGKLTELMVEDRNLNPSKYSVVLVSEGATFSGGEMSFQGSEQDGFGHRKLGGIGDLVSANLKDLSAQYNNGHTIDVVNQRLAYMVRSGDPDAIDSIVPIAFGNQAMNLIDSGKFGRMVSLRNGRYESVPISIVTSCKKLVDVKKYYSTERYRPLYVNFEDRPMWIMTSD
ncbi:MAG: ATP-dependent 6-phosphofructokinase [Bdellovibrionales bacterium]|jgi:ATP-dependent phosphofructokinase / diphosphate-dependent phosphofructokinase|nr:ATP-dependent 6-phosphofructokinase [Bdellovibrionales bacterium]MBT3526973.1 ATP-dependent 6-phosphofructokinase [Bdellovibrionales bacterium]MBT7767041.1 ATP-dependent 6-phosphofructokinase [Bdellovibrionales bacterium]